VAAATPVSEADSASYFVWANSVAGNKAAAHMANMNSMDLVGVHFFMVVY
jgi:hypothetical protein